MNELPPVHMPREGVREWRRTIQHRRNLVNSMTQTKNRIRSLLKSRDLKKAHPGTWWNTTNRTWMRQEAERGDAPWRDMLGDLLDMLELQGQQLKRVTRRLDAHLDELPGAWLLMTIPGVGPRTVEAVLAYIDDIRRFRRGKQYGSYFGVTPRLDESGSRRRTGHISKQGSSVVRWLIVESAWRTVRHSPALRAFHERVMHGQRQRNKIAIVATARKLLTIMRAMLMTGKTFNESLASEEVVLAQRSRRCVA